MDKIITCKIYHEGDIIWWLHNNTNPNTAGCNHNNNGPAAEYSFGTKEWLQYGKHHRLDGLAIEGSKSIDGYYIDGIQYNALEYWIAIEAMQ